MVKPHPSLTLVLDVDERVASEETRLEIKRCWAHVGSTVVRKHAATSDAIVNTAQFLVKMGTTKYLRSADAGADEMWNEVVEQWLYNMFHKVGNNMKIFNRRQREENLTELYFDTLDVDMEDGTCVVSIRLDSQSDIPPETSKVISTVRKALNEGILGDGKVRVALPSSASWETQVEQGREAATQREAQKLAEEQAARIAEEEAALAAAQAAEENFAPAPDLVEPDEQELDEERIRAELEARFALPEADFAVDYARWDVTYPDGSIREFDSATWSFLD